MVRVICEGDTWELVSQPPRSALLLTTTMSSKTDDNENDPQSPGTAQTLFLPHDPRFSPYLCNPPATPLRSLPPNCSTLLIALYPITTISTPYTPISLRSAPSSNGSSLATPASVSGNSRRLSLNLSPEVSFQAKTTSKKSLADIADNWRTRANENGIKVESSEDSQYLDDEGEIPVH